MSEITDLLAEWVEKEAPRDSDGNLIADRFDFFKAGYKYGVLARREGGEFITDEAAGVEFNKKELDYLRALLLFRDDKTQSRATVLRKILRLQQIAQEGYSI